MAEMASDISQVGHCPKTYNHPTGLPLNPQVLLSVPSVPLCMGDVSNTAHIKIQLKMHLAPTPILLESQRRGMKFKEKHLLQRIASQPINKMLIKH